MNDQYKARNSFIELLMSAGADEKKIPMFTGLIDEICDCKEEIEELIKNIKNIKSENDYCIGIVTVQNQKEKNLLIDGQQILTTLYLIAIYCGLINKPNQILLNF